MLTNRNRSPGLAVGWWFPPPGPVSCWPARVFPGISAEATLIELHAMRVVDQIEADHVTIKVRVDGRWLRRKVCALCRRPAPCAARQRAADIRAGLVDVTGRPVAIPRQRQPAAEEIEFWARQW